MSPDAVLARLTDDHLAALAATIDKVRPGPSPNLLEWLTIAIDREQHRRIGVELVELTLEEALPAHESAIAIAAALAMRDAVQAGGVRDLLGAVVDELMVGTRQ